MLIFEIISREMLARGDNFLIKLGIKASLEPGNELFDIGRQVKWVFAWSFLPTSPSRLKGVSIGLSCQNSVEDNTYISIRVDISNEKREVSQ